MHSNPQDLRVYHLTPHGATTLLLPSGSKIVRLSETMCGPTMYVLVKKKRWAGTKKRVFFHFDADKFVEENFSRSLKLMGIIEGKYSASAIWEQKQNRNWLAGLWRWLCG